MLLFTPAAYDVDLDDPFGHNGDRAGEVDEHAESEAVDMFSDDFGGREAAEHRDGHGMATSGSQSSVADGQRVVEPDSLEFPMRTVNG